MPDRSPAVVLVSTDFKGQLRKLAKRYRLIKSDLQPLLDELEAGGLPGDVIPGSTYRVFKVRLKNSDIKKGKSGGYRVIYQQKDSTDILLVTIYSKSDASTVTASEIQTIIDHFDRT